MDEHTDAYHRPVRARRRRGQAQDRNEDVAARPGRQAGVPQPDLLIIDEAVWPRAVRDTRVELEALVGALDRPEWRETMTRLGCALASPRALEAVRRDVGGERLAAARELLAARKSALRADVEEALARRDLAAARKLAPELGMLRRAGRVLAAVAAELDMPRASFNGVEFEPGDTAGRIACVRCHHLARPQAVRDDTPVLLLDASGDPELASRALGLGGLDCRTWRIARNAHFTQISSRTMSRGQVLGSTNQTADQNAATLRRQILEFMVARAAGANGPVLVVSYKGYAEEAADALTAAGVPAIGLHFGKLRGQNGAQACSMAFIIGREQPARDAEHAARAVFARDPEPLTAWEGEPVLQSRRYRMRDGSVEVVETPVHPDPRVQRVLEQSREREIEQALDRLRLIHNPAPKRVFVLTAIPLDIVVDEVIEWRDRMAEEDAITTLWRTWGVVPTGARRLAEVLDIAPAKADWLLEKYGSSNKRPEAGTPIGTTVHFHGGRDVLFRAAGQRGQASPARVDPARHRTIVETRDALEALLGTPVTELGYAGRRRMLFASGAAPAAHWRALQPAPTVFRAILGTDHRAPGAPPVLPSGELVCRVGDRLRVHHWAWDGHGAPLTMMERLEPVRGAPAELEKPAAQPRAFTLSEIRDELGIHPDTFRRAFGAKEMRTLGWAAREKAMVQWMAGRVGAERFRAAVGRLAGGGC
ncbi:hypothetical protein HL658_01385 [Azospirillum sp. RWY-5-1]|nr:hypothetical protein [Azospirillum oleiclasticum]